VCSTHSSASNFVVNILFVSNSVSNTRSSVSNVCPTPYHVSKSVPRNELCESLSEELLLVESEHVRKKRENVKRYFRRKPFPFQDTEPGLLGGVMVQGLDFYGWLVTYGLGFGCQV